MAFVHLMNCVEDGHAGAFEFRMLPNVKHFQY